MLTFRSLGLWATRLRSTASLVGAAVLLGLGGCGPVMYSSALGDAVQAVAQADAERASDRAPHAYRSAVEYLRKAEEEALVGAYGNAIAHAETAKRWADQALETSQTWGANRENKAVSGARPIQKGELPEER